MELAEERLLELDHDLCQKARSDLTNPRTRLNAEMAWLPGVSPAKGSQLVRRLLEDPVSAWNETGLPTLARLNLMAASLEIMEGKDSLENISDFIVTMGETFGEIEIDQIFRDINEDRAVSGFPDVKSAELIQPKISNRLRYYTKVIMEALDRHPTNAIVDVLTDAVDYATSGGTVQAAELIDGLVDSYSVEVQGFLEREADNIQKLIEAARSTASAGEQAIKPIVDNLVVVASNWDRVAQPVQLSFRARGMAHKPSQDVAYCIRSLAVELYNKHGMLDQAQRLTELVKGLFVELPDVLECVEEDSEQLADIFRKRKQTEAQHKQWEQEITYRVEIGRVFKNTLSISPEGILWKGKLCPLESITHIRWGIVRHYTNGIPTGTDRFVSYLGKDSGATVNVSKESVYTTFVDKLWRAVGIRLLSELLRNLGSGQQECFGDTTVVDEGIFLRKKRFLGKGEPVHYSWGRVTIWNQDGAFWVGARDDKKTFARLAYLEVYNVHILEQAIRMLFKRPELRKLSELLQ